jgi:transcriptional regulator with XRE-family HTH domain
MKFAEALRQTMFKYRLTGADLARMSGVSISQVNQFKNGKRDIATSNFQKIIEALPDEAKMHFLQLTVLANQQAN